MPVLKLSNLPKSNKTPNSHWYMVSDKLEADKSILINDIQLHYNDEVDGGGKTFGRRMKIVLSEIYPYKTWERVFEWCAGAGFIGFELLSSGICDNLYCADIYDPAIYCMNKTIQNLPEKYSGRVNLKKIKGIKDLPSEWKFDLVVANPPHWNPSNLQMSTILPRRERIGIDTDWMIHQEFYKNISSHLNKNSTIFIQEWSDASGPESFRSMIEISGLILKEVYYEADYRYVYYLEITKQ